jgi:hypothetical protein
MHVEGTLFREYSEADGGNHCHIVSSDHPIISLVRIGGGNWQGNGGGQIMYMPLSHSWDETHTDIDLPTNAAAGYYRIWSIVNGIPCKWYEECIEHGTEEQKPKTESRKPKTKVYPNPATTKASIKFRVQSSELKDRKLSTLDSRLLTLNIYDLSGSLVKVLSITDYRLPITEVTWDGRDSEGRKVKSGVYFYQINYDGNHEDRGKLVILK